MSKRRILRCEVLERRDVPTQFGLPWANQNITLSFVPDGTNVDGTPSRLFQSMTGSGLSEGQWQTQILRAAQTWLSYANLNVGVVADSGAAMGSAGLSQGDPRFGDIRIAARPLSADVFAITVPPNPVAGTRQGDIVFNSDYGFGIGTQPDRYDIYSVVLQEFAHSVGLGNSPDIQSPRYDVYMGVREGLTAGDINDIQVMYGARRSDVWDASGENVTPESADEIATPESLATAEYSTVVFVGDLAANVDSNYFRFVAPLDAAGPALLSLVTNGESLLSASVSVLNANGSLVAVQSSNGPLSGDLTQSLVNLQPGGEYFVRVDSSTSDFSVGRYEIRLSFNADNVQPPGPLPPTYARDWNTNETPATGSTLTSGYYRPGFFAQNGRFENAADVDVYRLRVPILSAAQRFVPRTLSLLLQSADGNLDVRPQAVVTDSQNNVLVANVVMDENGTCVLQVANLMPGEEYFIISSADPSANSVVGDYRLEADLRASDAGFERLGDGEISANASEYFTSFTISEGAVAHFVVQTSDVADSTPTAAQLDVYNLTGQSMLSIFARTGRSASGSTFLAPGEYILRLRGLTQDPNAALATYSFRLDAGVLSDSIGPQTSDPDGISPFDAPNISPVHRDDAYYRLQFYEDSPGAPNW